MLREKLSRCFTLAARVVSYRNKIKRVCCSCLLILLTAMTGYRLLLVDQSKNGFFPDQSIIRQSNDLPIMKLSTNQSNQLKRRHSINQSTNESIRKQLTNQSISKPFGNQVSNLSTLTISESNSKRSCYVEIFRPSVAEQELTPTASFKLLPRNRSVSQPEISTMGIPRIIHQMWKDEATVPTIFRKWVSSWPIMLARDGWEYWLWTHNDMRRFAVKWFPQYISLYDSYPADIYRADMFRYMLFYKYGGVYADLDVDALKSIDKLIDQWECAISQEPFEHAHFFWDMTPPLVSSAFMACRPSHQFNLLVLSSLHGRLPGCLDSGPGQIVGCTGPVMLSDVYRVYVNRTVSGAESDPVLILDADLFQPPWPAYRYLHKCSNRAAPQKRPELHDMLCKRLRDPSYGQHQLTAAYTRHHWSNIYVAGARSLLERYFDISLLASDVNNSPDVPGNAKTCRNLTIVT